MRVRKLFSLTILLVLLTALTGAAGGAPLAGVCIPGGAYDPACDVDHDGDVDIFDVQLTAGHWSQNGVYVSDNNHNHLGQTWTGADNPITIQGSFAGPALTVNNSAGLGLRVGTGGLNVSSAVDDGVLVGTVGGDGVYIYSAGENGVRISSAGGYGLIVGHTAYDGVFIVSADSTGLNVQLAETGAYVASAGWNGMVVEAAGGDGMRVVSATYNGVYANTTQASGEWGFYTPDKIHGSNVLLESVSLVAQVSGAESLTAGDLVMAAGIADPLLGSTVHLPQVQAAAGAPGGVVGVVEGRLALTSRPWTAAALPRPPRPRAAGRKRGAGVRTASRGRAGSAGRLCGADGGRCGAGEGFGCGWPGDGGSTADGRGPGRPCACPAHPHPRRYDR